MLYQELFLPSWKFPSIEGYFVSLVNLVIYGGSCSFTVNDIANVTACSGSNVVLVLQLQLHRPIYGRLTLVVQVGLTWLMGLFILG
jgi:hypothetical protein